MTLKIEIEGSRNLNKVAVTQALREHTNLGLKESKSKTDELVNSGVTTFEAKDLQSRVRLIERLEQANANITSK